eukprot:5569801-Pleurochrysis_carterae.AAC.1
MGSVGPARRFRSAPTRRTRPPAPSERGARGSAHALRVSSPTPRAHSRAGSVPSVNVRARPGVCACAHL